MDIHYIQHVPFENLGSMEKTLLEKGHTLTPCHIYKCDRLPEPSQLDWLIVMGGPMGVGDERIYPWLRSEKKLIAQAIHAGKKVLGICLGAQLVADVLGARVYRGAHKEIGWFDIHRHSEADDTFLASCWPEKICAFHWHGDTFDIPAGGKRLASSAACENQGFVYENTLALQFHLETTTQSASRLIENCSEELDGSTYVQSAEDIMADKSKFTRINKLMTSILELF